MPKSSFKSPRNERDQLVDDTAGILAAMVKTRRSAYDKRFISEQVQSMKKFKKKNIRLIRHI